MTASVPWSVNAVEPETWAAARDAARRSGMTVGEWLDATIRECAEQGRTERRAQPAGYPLEHRLDDIADRLDHLARSAPAAEPRTGRQHSEEALFASIEALSDRIDGLMRDLHTGDHNVAAEVREAIQRLDDRIEGLLSRGRIANGGAAPELQEKLASIAETIETIGRRLEHETRQNAAEAMPSSVDELDEAIAAIMMRQSVLDGVPPPARRAPQRPAAPAPSVDLGGLEKQLKVMADEMQALRLSGKPNETVETLRREISDLAGHLSELAPRRSLEALEGTVEKLVQRIDRATADDRTSAMLTEVSQALHDIREALASVRPAENFTSVETGLRELSSKLDHLTVSGIDASTVTRLQEQATEIRELLSNALPTDALNALVQHVEKLTQKIERAPATPDPALMDLLNAFDKRLETLSERIDAASQQAPAAPALDDIRTRIDELQRAVGHAGQSAPPELEAALQNLAKKVDAADARLANLGTIENGIRDLFEQLQEARARVSETAERAAEKAAERAVERATTSVMRDVTPALAAVAGSEGPRRQLAELETRFSTAAQKAEPLEPAPLAAERPEPHPVPAVLHAAAETESPDEIEADLPLEPGSGAPRLRMQSATLRVAQSEAALHGIAAGSETNAPRTADFIAAARRAAQAAANEPVAEAPAAANDAAPRKARGSLFTRGRTAFLIALTAFLVIFTAMRFFNDQLPAVLPLNPPAAESQAPAGNEPENAAPELQNQTALPDPMESVISAAPPSGMISLDIPTSFIDEWQIDFTPTGSTGSAGSTETAGSTASTGSTASSVAPAAVEAAPSKPKAAEENELPAALGTPALRTAAAAGHPLAAYEIGVRYLDGRGVRANTNEGVKWLERAFAKGSPQAAYRLGSLYEKGTGVAKNPAKSRRYYLMAAEAGNLKAMHNLAVSYAEGSTGDPDYRMAARWFRQAAERGVADSQYNLGVLYARGLGVDQNFAESFRWFALAANQGDAEAGKRRDDVAHRLDIQTLVATRLAVQTWSSKPVDASVNEVRLHPDWETPKAAAQRKPSAKK